MPNPFIESLELSDELMRTQPTLAYEPTQYTAYHGSPFSPEDMNIVFRRQGYGDSWAIIPVQPYHIREDGLQVEPFGEGPTVSAGSWQSARTRAFLNKHADHFIGVDTSAGFSSAGVLDAMDQPIVTVPTSIAERLTTRQPDGYVHTVDLSQEGFAPTVFSSEAHRARDRYEHRTKHMVHPVGSYVMSFAEFIEGQPLIVVDTHFMEVKQAEQSIAALREQGDRSIHGEDAVLDHFRRIGITARLLAEM